MKVVAVERRRFGYRRIHVMLDRQGIVMNQKKLRRLYREPGWQVGEQRSRVFLPAYPRGLDTCQLAQWAIRVLGVAPPKDFKLGTLCAFLEIEIGDAHDALVDARLTIEVARRMTAAPWAAGTNA